MASVLKLDCDRKLDRIRIADALSLLGIKPLRASVFRTANGFHVYIHIKGSLTDMETVALQVILGSDYRRECFNLMRVRSNNFKDGSWNILFSRKKYAIKKKKLIKISAERYDERLSKALLKVIRLYDN